MFRLALALAVWICLGPGAPAYETPRKDGRLFDKGGTHLHVATATERAPNLIATRTQPSDYVVTEDTEVLLNGRPCRYSEVPPNATILNMELAWDNKTVLKVHFRAAPPATATSRPPGGR